VTEAIPDYRIRPLVEPDITPVLKLTRLVPEAPWWNETHIRQLVDPDSPGPHNPPFRRGWVCDRGSPDDAHPLCGFIVIHALRIGSGPGAVVECEIESIVVHPAFRRRGIARTLLRTALAWCGEQRASILRLEVRKGNEPAIRVYEGAGFVATGTRARYYESPPDDALLMELLLLPKP
jgi:ribosomal protein S18 acetylase RimI-like enzyme